MTRKEFNKELKDLNQQLIIKVKFSYNEYQYYMSFLEKKINYQKKTYKKYKNLFELSEWTILIWGLLAYSSTSYMKLEDKDKIGIVFHALTTQLSNNSLAILLLCERSLDMQFGTLIRSHCELLCTLLTVLINKNKRLKYFKSANKQNEKEVWRKEFRFYQLIQEIKNFEEKTMMIDKETQTVLEKFLKNLYASYSDCTHSSFLTCILNAYSPRLEKKEFSYNMWGTDSSRIQKELLSLCDLNFIILLELFNYVIRSQELKDVLNANKESRVFYEHAVIFYSFFKKRYLKYRAKLEGINLEPIGV